MTGLNCVTPAGQAAEAELFLFATEANAALDKMRAERDELKDKYFKLLDVCADLYVKCDRYEMALDTSIDVMTLLERRHAQK